MVMIVNPIITPCKSLSLDKVKYKRMSWAFITNEIGRPLKSDLENEIPLPCSSVT